MTQAHSGMTWLGFALMTVVMWGLYGIFLHGGQLGMSDPDNGRHKAFLMVGAAYFLTAVLAPALLLYLRGATWIFPMKGVIWSLIAGLVGAGGAFCVLLAFGAKGSPAVVMTIVFAGAPIVNAFVAMSMHPPTGGFRAVPKLFYVGILLAALGGALVTLFKPNPAAGKPASAPAADAGTAHDG